MAIVVAGAAWSVWFYWLKTPYIEKQIVEANYCEVDSDCVQAGSQCPFGCYILVHSEEKDRIADLLQEDIPGGECSYSCIAPGEVVCESQKCVMKSQFFEPTEAE